MKMNITPPVLLAQNLSLETDINVESPEMEVWDPPFERWMRLVDSLLEKDASHHRLSVRDTRPC
jgi:hypothetical protein